MCHVQIHPRIALGTVCRLPKYNMARQRGSGAPPPLRVCSEHLPYLGAPAMVPSCSCMPPTSDEMRTTPVAVRRAQLGAGLVTPAVAAGGLRCGSLEVGAGAWDGSTDRDGGPY